MTLRCMRSQHAPQKRKFLLSIPPLQLRVLAAVTVLGLLLVSLSAALLRSSASSLNVIASPALASDGERGSPISPRGHHARSDSSLPVDQAVSPLIRKPTALELFRGDWLLEGRSCQYK